MGNKIFFTIVIGVLLYTRFVGLDWGLPYPMHPDERNMVNAVQQLHCEISSRFDRDQISNCFNPHFYAYGQFPLYLSYFGIQTAHILSGVGKEITFEEATMALRTISAAASIINIYILLKLIQLLMSKIKGQKSKIQVKNQKFEAFNFLLSPLTFAFCFLTFSPYFIQFSHFGTTESLLMLFYSLIVYGSLKMMSSLTPRYYFFLAVICGLAIATKVSSVVFLIVPISIFVFLSFRRNEMTEKSSEASMNHALPQSGIAGFLTSESEVRNDILKSMFLVGKFLFLVIIVFIIFSPHTIISFPEFMASMTYESSVALSTYLPFYTRQFVNTTPIVFQFIKIFPYALGWPQFVLALFGFVFLSWKNKYFNFLRFAFLIYFIPTAFTFAKWSRFMAPIFPLLSMFAVLFLFYLLKGIQDKFLIHNLKFLINFKLNNLNLNKNLKFKILNCFFFVLIILIILPGIAYLSIYQQPDVRFKASEWIYSNIPAESKILSETANVVDIPFPTNNVSIKPKNYFVSSFNFYDLDANPSLQQDLKQLVKEANYIFVPSRRIFMNHGCGSLLSKRVSNFQGSRQRADEASTGGKENETGLRFDCNEYPILNNYYQQLFSGSLGFEKVAEISSYPRIEAFGKTLLEFPDELSEETWTVFDHPVIRIYKKIPNPKSQIPINSQILNLKNYQTTNYQLIANNYKLLVADTPEKWEQGLMYIKNKNDIGGLDGMMFIFPEAAYRTFWNKNTVSDLDLYWISDDKQVEVGFLPSIEKSKQIVTTSSPGKVNKVIEIIKE